MSFYTTIEGRIKYGCLEDLNASVKFLYQNLYLKYDKFIDETGEFINQEVEKDIDVENLQINIPYGYYRNLTRFFDQLLENSVSHHVVWTSTDGCFCGECITDGKKTSFNDLAKWVTTYDAPDPETQFDEYCIWMSDIENMFFETYGE